VWNFLWHSKNQKLFNFNFNFINAVRCSHRSCSFEIVVIIAIQSEEPEEQLPPGGKLLSAAEIIIFQLVTELRSCRRSTDEKVCHTPRGTANTADDGSTFQMHAALKGRECGCVWNIFTFSRHLHMRIIVWLYSLSLCFSISIYFSFCRVKNN